MPVTYVLVERANPAKPTAPKKFYAQLKSGGEVTIRQLMKEISARSTVSNADTMSVLESLLEIIPEKLAQGLIVRLGDLGSFFGTLTSAGAERADLFVSSTMITGYKIRFRPGRELTKAVSRQEINATLQQLVDAATEPWGVQIEMVEIKDVEIPESMQRAMAREAEAIREKRARIIKAEAELEASIKLTQGAKQMEDSPLALELRRLQMLSEIGIDNNTTTIVMVPSEFTNAARSFTQMMQQGEKS